VISPVAAEYCLRGGFVIGVSGNWPDVDDATAEKIAWNNSTFRDANDAIEVAAVEHRFDRDQPIPFICECSDGRCTEIVSLTLEEYQHIRSNERWFAHSVGHEEAVEGAVVTVERHSRFVVVEKINRAGEVAQSLAGETPEA
jgi:hypothetical protein